MPNQPQVSCPAAAGIQYDEKQRVFHLQGLDFSYLIQIYRDGYLGHLYWGRKIQAYHGSQALRFADRAFSPNPDPTDRTFSLDTMPQEYPAFGNTDFRAPAVQLEWPDGCRISDFRYDRHTIQRGKPGLDGLPATYAETDDEAETLVITLKDTCYPVYADLAYTVFKQANVLTRSVRIRNESAEPLQILKAASANVDFRDDAFRLLHLSGAWGRERDVIEKDLAFGIYQIESRRGASSHQHNPFLALLRPDTTETQGEVFAWNLVYSGNFLAQVEVDGFHYTRVNIGLNPFDFSWRLLPAESFQTPEVVMAYAADGLGSLSRTLHRLYRQRLCRGTYRDQIRPILINNWEATYFDFDEAKIVEIARQASQLGIELMVLDDGWFGRRNSDTCSLGDWVTDQQKLPAGLDGLVSKVSQLGMQFGLWVEPEMISPDSDLYRTHPDWCLHVPGRNRSESRNQLVLDLSRADVRAYLIQTLSEVFQSTAIRYVKWDMNRHMTEVGSANLPASQQREVSHRYMLGLYAILETLVSRFPAILFESCSGGGGRFDPGMLYYMPQTWTSDNTDAIERLKIQYGTSLAYPAITMGSHVSAVPNHQVQRTTSLQMRGNVAMAGNFGYEIDLTSLSGDEQALVASQVSFARLIRPLVQFGDLYRLHNPFRQNTAAWMFVAPDAGQACVFYYKILSLAQESFMVLRLQGLDPVARYQTDSGEIYGGDELMYAGLPLPVLPGDFQSTVVLLTRLADERVDRLAD